MLQRLRNDYQLSIITMLSGCAVVVVLPSTFYRFYIGDTILSMLGSVVMATIVLGMLYAWRTGHTERSGHVFVFACIAGGIMASFLIDGFGFVWLYPGLVASFILVRPITATVLNGVAIATLVFSGVVFPSALQTLAYVASTVSVSIGSCIFALRNEYQRQQLERLAIFDSLTGIRNRRALDVGMHNAVTHAARTQVPYGLIMMDLDHFKQINDAYGHDEGDRVLICCAALLRQDIRGADRLYRFGGEEFVIILTNVSRQGMEAMVTELRHKLARDLRCHDKPVTASFGATLLRQDELPEAWLARADNALYRAKNNGRNRVVIASADDNPVHDELCQEVA